MNKQYFHICNPTTPTIVGYENIVSRKELHDIHDNSNSVYLINVHLNWERNKLSNNYGFDIAQDIRTKKKSKAPIIFYSPIQQEYFEKASEKNYKYLILFARGTSFISWPIKEPELNILAKKIKPLSNAALHDVSVASCDLKGIVIEKLKHDLKFEQGEQIVIKTIESVFPYLNEDQKNKINLNIYLKELIEKVKLNDKIGFEKERDLFVARCERYLTADNSETEISIPEIRHTIVVVDDEKNFLKYIEDNLSENFVVVPFDNAENAWNYLQSDDSLKVKAVISDWRLYNGKYMQQMQGYELLEYVGNTGFRALFTLSMQAEFLVHQIRNKMSVRFTMYKKDNLEEPGQWKTFRDLLDQQCTEINEVIAAIPKKDSWMKPQRKGKQSYYEEYLERRNSAEWEPFENSISKSSSLIWKDYYWKYLKNELGEALQDFSKRFGLPINSLESMLIARRICLALYFRQNYQPKKFDGVENPKINVYRIFRNKDFDDEVEINRREFGDEKIDKDGKRYSVEEWTKKLMTGTATSLLNTELGFNLDEVVSFKGIFPEERNWLNHNGIEFSLEYVYDDIENEDDDNNGKEKEPSAKDLKEIDAMLNKSDRFDEDDEPDNLE